MKGYVGMHNLCRLSAQWLNCNFFTLVGWIWLTARAVTSNGHHNGFEHFKIILYRRPLHHWWVLGIILFSSIPCACTLEFSFHWIVFPECTTSFGDLWHGCAYKKIWGIRTFIRFKDWLLMIFLWRLQNIHGRIAHGLDNWVGMIDA
jgi:hypothetical protein